jgi:hypothetical protein
MQARLYRSQTFTADTAAVTKDGLAAFARVAI